MMATRLLRLTLACLLLASGSLACGEDDSSGAAGGAGSPDGGPSGSGGAPGTGGSPGTGGAPSTGGSPGTGGSAGQAGSSGTGGGAGDGGNGGDGGFAGAAGAAGSPCVPVTLGNMILVDTEPGGSSIAYSLEGLSAGQDHALYVEFFDSGGPQTVGSFDLSQPPNDNYETCTHCLLAYEDINGASPTAFFQARGVLAVTTADTAYTGASAGNFVDIELTEVTIVNKVTTPVPGGRCLSLQGSWDNTSP